VSVYLLHFAAPISPAHTTQHYLGYADDVDARLREHAAGRGARLTQVARDRGIAWRLVRTWAGYTRDQERSLKNQRNAPRLCPICRAQRALALARTTTPTTTPGGTR
jgi:predicted GIY-YIG superfamily endonuclease